MTVDEEKLWQEISERWRSVGEKVREEELNNIVLEDEISADQFGNISGLSRLKAFKRLERMVVNKEATKRKIKIGKYWTNVYRLVQPDIPEHL